MNARYRLRHVQACDARCLAAIAAQQDGWKMTDRFYGFRYGVSEKGDPAAADALIEALVAKANSYKCFGWAQKVLERGSGGRGAVYEEGGPR